MTKSWKKGGCHCGAVRWEAETDDAVVVEECNCSICRMTGFLHIIVPASQFQLLAGADDIVDYRFNTGVARHLFCRHCGVKSFYAPRSNPDGYSLKLRCMDENQFAAIEFRKFDGRNWEAHGPSLAELSKD